MRLRAVITLQYLERYHKAIVGLFFLGLFILGLSIYRNYSYGVDDPIERLTGIVSLQYIANKLHLPWQEGGIYLQAGSAALQELQDAGLNQFIARDYPVLFNMPAALLERILKIDDLQAAIYLRHLLNYVVCLVGMYAIYRLIVRRFHDWRLGLLGVLFFISSPRLFADTFYNNKDLVFLTFFAIATNSLVQFILRPNRNNAIVHGVATALAINVRIMGVLFLFLSVLLLCLRCIKGEHSWRSAFRELLYYLICTLALTYLLWPWLWANPVGHLLEGFANMAHFRQNFPIAYLGQAILTTQLPWHYAPVYIAITTPILYLLLFLVGAVAIFKNVIQARLSLWTNEDQLQDVIFLGLFISPIVAVIGLHSVLYNGWRQLYFIYPSFIVIAIGGLVLLWRFPQGQSLLRGVHVPFSPRLQRGLHILIVIAISGTMLNTAAWMIRNHPYESLYYNILAGRNWDRNFEGDYWALAQRATLMNIAKQDDRAIVRVTGVWHDIIDGAARAKILSVDQLDMADYVVGDADPTQFEKIDEIRVAGKPISAAWRRRQFVDDLLQPHLAENITFASGASGTRSLLAVGMREQTGWGWSHPENWGVWSEGRQASLLMAMPNPKPTKMRVVLKAMITPSHPSQQGNLYINGYLAKRLNLTAQETMLEVDLSQAMRARNYLQIEFTLRNPASPKSLGLGDDVRHLGVGLVSIQLL